ncbi:hypothetical protein UCRNP2_6867 [Neofusicoccum parvum UCRNP2]|uniref:DUF7514 domain-containing protein n=1 Tax=Botryosphaeria parva (strain UCR-NP2) TaxID=1287680 RepID=R1G4T3_BOTPV|nr:hypothetical protein UCRNP2_6867 [Neofusicoccum parvum UCRNP2]
MAYDYRNADQPPSPREAYLESSTQPSSASSYSASARPRTSRSSSGDRSQSSQQGQPVYEAVNNAFDKSGTANTLDPDLVAQITEEHSNTSAHAQHPLRPQVQRHLTDVEETAIEKTWRQLFDADGQPTPRLSQFLRGLALHLIDDYEPKHTLVVTPAKMRKFYEDTRTQDEIYPWSTIFGTLSNSAISKMYRDLRCSHHLVQEKTDEVPNTPALTPAGFRMWMTLMIQGHPDIEFARLAKAVMHMPISNADDIKERFPKELPRRLFPRIANLQTRQRFR